MSEEERSDASPDYHPGERGHTVPRFAWWILGIAMVLLLVLVVARPSWFTRAADDDSLHVPSDRHFTKTVDGLGFPDGLWLNDDISASSFVVRVPVDSGRSDTRLRLRGDTQVADDSTAFLAVVIDGDQVYRSQLPHGDNDLDQLVGIPAGAADDGSVRVQIRIDGALHHETCTDEHSIGAGVHIAPDTMVEAALDQPVHTVRDLVSSWDRELTVVVPDSGDPWRSVAGQLGIGLTQAGHRVSFTEEMPVDNPQNVVLVGPDEALAKLGWHAESADPVAVGTATGTPVLAVRSTSAGEAVRLITGTMITAADGTGEDPRRVPASRASGDDVALADLGIDQSTVSITENHTWRVSYGLADLPDGRLPRAVRVAWTLPAGPDDLTWIVNTSLNGRLIDSRRLGDGPPPVIPLPAGMARVDNTLTFTVQRDRNLGGCDVRETKYSMAVAPGSVLLLSDDPGDGLVSLPKVLAPGFAVYVTAPGDADLATLLGASVATISRFTADGVVPEFVWGSPPPTGKGFVQIGTSNGVATPIAVTDDRLVSHAPPAVDVSALGDGILVSTGTTDNAVRGLVIQPVGSGTVAVLPAFGTESAQIITEHGSIALNATGAPVADGP